MIKCWSWWCYIIIIIIINVAGGPTTRSFQNYHCNSKKVITSSSLWILQEVLLHTLLHILLHICWMPIRNNWWNYIRILIPKLEIVYPTKVPVLVILPIMMMMMVWFATTIIMMEYVRRGNHLQHLSLLQSINR